MTIENIVCVGHFAKNTEIDSRRISHETFGGSGYHTSVAASFVKIPGQMIGAIGRIGNDEIGQQIVRRLIDYGVDITGIEVAENEKTAWFEIEEAGRTSRNRKFRSSLEAGDAIPARIPDSYRQAKYIHLATAPPQQQLEWLARFYPQLFPDTLITVDAFETYARQFPMKTINALKSATGYVFLNQEEWEILEKWGQQNRVFNSLRLFFQVPVILKKAEEGANMIYPSGDSISIPAKKVEYINGTGAGETLAAVFLTLRAQGVDEIISLKIAVELASLSVEDFGVEHIKNKIVTNRALLSPDKT